MEPAINKRIIFNNIFIEKENNILLMNMISFRRRFISKDELNQLKKTMQKINAKEGLTEEDSLYFKLIEEKQILDENIIMKTDEFEKRRCHIKENKIINAKFDITYKCNMNCNYCYERSFKNKKETMSENDVDKIKEFIKKYNNDDELGLKSVSINGGEPLLKENLKVINKILSSINAPKVKLYTNGINILKFKDEIDFSKFTDIQVSLDGDDDIISQISNKRLYVFKDIVQGIEYLMQFDNKIMIACLFVPGISSRIVEFVKKLKETKIFKSREDIKIIIDIPFKPGKDGIDHEFFSLDEYIRLREIIKGNNLQNYVQLSPFANISRLAWYLNRKINLQVERKVCICSSERGFSFAFGPKGNVYWCQCQGQDSSVIANYYTNKINLNTFNELINRNVFSVPECKVCVMRYFCGAGCPMSLLADKKNKNRPSCGELCNGEIINRLEELL